MAANSGALIEIDSISKRYNETVRALDNVSFSVEGGEFLTIVGRSGSGKSTLLYIIGGLDHPTGGEIRISGNATNFADRDALVRLRRKKVGFVFQQFNLLPAMTAADNVAYPLLFHRRPLQERCARAEELLGLVGLADRADHYPAELSGGEQQRVAIARALVADPPIVLADEPTGNLDSRTSSEIYQLLRDVNREQGTTFLVVTHERDLATFSDRSIELLDGRVVS
ncbi:MAG TPA: ABC transporter ATP-binding protein [Methanoregulaceae archaeon]|jgi:ABC-type lipoprotein export system ATPase subunit|nr:ABC transporter ATP-binding protein [Methanoregulaceae archaeon]